MSKSSPFEAVHKVLGANFAEYDGWLLPTDYGDRTAEAEALAQGCVAFDLSSFGRITIKGAQGEILMDRLLAGGADKCCQGKWMWAGLSDGRAGADKMLRVGKVGADFAVFTLPAQREAVLRLAQSLTDEAGLADVKIDDITAKSAMLGLYGPEAVRSAGSILPFDCADGGVSGGKIPQKGKYHAGWDGLPQRGDCEGADQSLAGASSEWSGTRGYFGFNRCFAGIFCAVMV